MASATGTRIFISYRRDDSGPYAGRLSDHLTKTFGESGVFMDVDSVELGIDFTEAIKAEVASCDVLLAIIGKEWLNATDDSGARRLENPDDFVRLEIEAALARNVRVIPILVDGASLPSAAHIPATMSGLVRRQAFRLTHEGFKTEAPVLIRQIEKVHATSRLTAEREEREKTDRDKAERDKADRDKADRDKAERDKAERAQADREEAARLEAEREAAARKEAEREAAARERRRRAVRWGAAAAVLVVAVVVGIKLWGGGDDSTVEVDGAVTWTDTGVDIEAGGSVVVDATGTIRHNKDDPSTAVGPDGADDDEVLDPRLNQVGLGVYVNPPGHGGLIGKVGEDGEVLGVGSHLEVHNFTTAGRLYLGINDYGGGNVDEAVANNDGSYRVTINATRQ